ncbi:Uncharacterised protein [Mycobacteroides abscessus subsp. abscessus]|nr:Uncharacterised protein [Mycobacteroides abscessus subsp. abscessus]
MGIDDELGEKILAWTDRFQKFFVTEIDGFAMRPRWRPGINVFDWYDEGYRIVSVNERRESMGLVPVSLPNEPKAGHISITELLHPKGPE